MNDDKKRKSHDTEIDSISKKHKSSVELRSPMECTLKALLMIVC